MLVPNIKARTKTQINKVKELNNKKILILKIPNFFLNQLSFEIDKGMMLLREYIHRQIKKRKVKEQLQTSHQILVYIGYNFLVQINFLKLSTMFHNSQKRLLMNKHKCKEAQQKIKSGPI